MSHIVNCQIGGFPNLKWNRYGNFDSLPPSTISFFNPDSLYTLQDEWEKINPLFDKSVSLQELSKNDYNLVVYYCWFMGRQSKRLIKEEKKYAAKFPDKKIGIIYVNFGLNNTPVL